MSPRYFVTRASLTWHIFFPFDSLYLHPFIWLVDLSTFSIQTNVVLIISNQTNWIYGPSFDDDDDDDDDDGTHSFDSSCPVHVNYFYSLLCPISATFLSFSHTFISCGTQHSLQGQFTMCLFFGFVLKGNDQNHKSEKNLSVWSDFHVCVCVCVYVFVYMRLHYTLQHSKHI